MHTRRFLFLQGPHGPFFRQLARRLNAAGHATLRVGFNAGDALFWPRGRDFIAFDEALEHWPVKLPHILAEHDITDLVIYGECRPIHDHALEIARKLGITTHIFEEGYLRPYWVTYERDGSNGHSPLCDIPLSAMQSVSLPTDAPETAAGWGELRQHIFYGALYHGALMAGRHKYKNYHSHRDISIPREAMLNILKFLAIPAHAIERRMSTARLRLGAYPYHLALLQLEHDASFRGHAAFKSISEFARTVIEGFAKGAKPHHHLVFKAHPLEDGRAGIRRSILDAAREAGIADRIHYLRGGKLAGLLDDAISAVTINSTAGQQVLRRGLPLKALGEAVYSGRGFTSDQPLAEFFANPSPPDLEAYRTFRRFQLETCQVAGGYYSVFGRTRLLRRVVDMMLSPYGPYARLQTVAEEQRHLRLVAE